jgi:glycerophosphoryl diester phosphodiesterase
MPSSPSSRQSDLRALIAKPFAHRGLHGPDVPENSRAAFEAAIRAGHGIELDVRGAMFEGPVVFHDERLDRLTDETGPVPAFGVEELQQIMLKGSDETIPWLGDILDLVAGQVPLLIELKATNRRANRLSYSVAFALEAYKGPVAVMSFNPKVGRWFARHAPKVLRGLVVTEQGKGWRGIVERRLALWWARPDLLAYDIRDLPSRFADAQRAGGMKVLTWTVRSLQDRARAAEHADQIIYEKPR